MRKLIFISLFLCATLAGAQNNSFSWIKQQTYIATGTNTYAITVPQYGTSGILASELKVQFTNGNTGASTLAINGGAATTMRKNGSSALASGDIVTGATYRLTFDGTYWQVLGIGGSGGSVAWSDITGKPNVLIGTGTNTLTGNTTITGSTSYSLTLTNLTAFDVYSPISAQIAAGSGSVLSLSQDLASISTGVGAKGIFFDHINGTTLTLGSDAANDMYYRNSSGYLTRLAAGTNGYVLTSSSGVPTWAAPSGGSGITIGSTSITGGTSGRLLTSGSTVGEQTLGTGVSTWLSTPSWTNFQSAITGTSPYLLTSGGTYTTTTGDGLALTSSTLTSGNLVSLTSTGTAAASSTQTVLNIATSGANGTSGQYTYGAKISNTHTGTSSRNYGLQIAVSGGTENYALEIYGSGRFNGSGSEAIYLNSSASSTAFIDMASSGTRRNRLLWTSTSPGYFETAGIGVGGVGTSGAGLSVAGGIVLQGADRYLNFTSTYGSSGYGLRDTAGTMEYKDSGGSWAAVSSIAKAVTVTNADNLGTGNIQWISGSDSGKKFENYFSANVSGSWNGASATTNILNTVPDNSTIVVTVHFTGVQTSGTAGSTGFHYKVTRAFRRTTSTTTAIGSATVVSSSNDTGDTFTTVPTLSTSGSNINFERELSTSKTFNVSLRIEVDITD